MTAGYSGTPLPKKLGIKDGSRVALIGAPSGFDRTLGALPSRVAVTSRFGGEADVIVLFATEFGKLQKDFVKVMAMMPSSGGMLWVAWPKKASKVPTDLDENLIRDFGLAQGVVDTKVCAIDLVWSGLRFNKRRA